MSSGMIVVMVVMMVVMMGGIGVGVLTFGRRSSRRSKEHPGEEDPLDVLRDRYARGEISSEEYEKRRGALEDSAGDNGR